MPTRRSKTRVLLWSLLALPVLAAIGLVSLLAVPASLEMWLRDRVLMALHEY